MFVPWMVTPWRGKPALCVPASESELFRDRTCGTLNHICNFLWMRDVDGVTRACHFDRLAVGPVGIPTFQIRVDGSIVPRHHHPARFRSPGCRSDRRREIVCKIEHLRARHECGLVGGKVSCEQFMKLRRVDIGETSWRFLYGPRFGEVAWKALSVV